MDALSHLAEHTQHTGLGLESATTAAATSTAGSSTTAQHQSGTWQPRASRSPFALDVGNGPEASGLADPQATR